MGRSAMEMSRRVLEAMGGVDLTKVPNGGFDPGIFSADAEFHLDQMGVPDEGTWLGPEGIVDGWQRWLAQWDGYLVRGSGLEDHGGGRVVVDVHIETHGRGSGVPMKIDQAQVWTWRDGLISAVHIYPNRAEALEALSQSAAG